MAQQLSFDGDVVIVGGGLAGQTLALALHSAGVSVAVVDRGAKASPITAIKGNKSGPTNLRFGLCILKIETTSAISTSGILNDEF